MTEDTLTLTPEQLQSIHRALNAAERQLKTLPSSASPLAYTVFLNLQAIRAVLAPNLLRSSN